MVQTLTEGQHRGGYIVSEANDTRSREVATVQSGQSLVAGQVVQFSGNELIAHDGLVDSVGAVQTPAAGIMFDNVDASAGAIAGAVYTARDSEVNADELTYPADDSVGTVRAAVEASLVALGIIPR